MNFIHYCTIAHISTSTLLIILILDKISFTVRKTSVRNDTIIKKFLCPSPSVVLEMLKFHNRQSHVNLLHRTMTVTNSVELVYTANDGGDINFVSTTGSRKSAIACVFRNRKLLF